MKIINDKITIAELKELSERMFGNFVKAVIDIEKEIVAVDAELHVDLEQLLIENGSEPNNLWGINIYPEVGKDKFIEFDSMINLKPSLGNRTRGIDKEEIREKIISIVNKVVDK
ncbi:MAG: DUF5674 family protein [Candidatus Staskawiczbacteria bacterium]|jgi:hypothetical protein